VKVYIKKMVEEFMEKVRTSRVLLEIRNVKKYFGTSGGFFGKSEIVRAVDGVNLTVYEGETLGLVGESGSGKSTLARMILRLIEPTSGEIYFDGQNILKLNRREMRKLRRNIQIVFQDPQSSLNPRMTVKKILSEPFLVHKMYNNKKFIENRILELLRKVGLSAEHLNRFPHELSGGQRQRLCIARALTLNPRLLVLDEPTSSLDVSVQAQILNLLQNLQKELNLTYIFISHDLGVVKYVADRIAVMYAGRIVEIAEKRDLFEKPLHPYTQLLLSAIPAPNPHLKIKRLRVTGEAPSPFNLPSGCRFHPRCPYAMDICKQIMPREIHVEPNHLVSCHLFNR